MLVLPLCSGPGVCASTCTITNVCRGRGQVVAAACAADVIILATSRGYLLRYHWDEYGNEKGAQGRQWGLLLHRTAACPAVAQCGAICCGDAAHCTASRLYPCCDALRVSHRSTLAYTQWFT
jgi:hypothetical protein